MVREDPPAGGLDDVDLEGLRSHLDTTEIRYALLFGSRARGEESPTSDVDVCLRFPDAFSPRERFRRRNNIDSALQTYADGFVDVSDLEALPDEVALNAVREGVLLCGDEEARSEDRRRLERSLMESSERRIRKRREFIDRLAEGDA